MKLSITTNARELVGALDALAKKEIPYATSRAVNATTKDAAHAAKVSLRSHMTIRNQGILRAGIKAVLSHKRQWPKLNAGVGVPTKFEFLADHETGKTRLGKGNHRRPVPTDVVRGRRTKGGKVRKMDKAGEARRRTGLTKRGGKAKYGRAFIPKGKRYLARTVSQGRGRRRRLEPIHLLRRVVRIDRDPWFKPAVHGRAAKVYPDHIKREFKAAVASARKRAGVSGGRFRA